MVEHEVESRSVNNDYQMSHAGTQGMSVKGKEGLDSTDLDLNELLCLQKRPQLGTDDLLPAQAMPRDV